MNTTTSVDMDAITQEYFDGIVQMEAEAVLIHTALAVEGEIDPGNGRTVSFPRLHAKPTVKTTLVEGVTPVPGSASLTKQTVATDQIGYWEVSSDLLELTVNSRFLNANAKAQGNQAARSVDWRVGQTLAAGTNVYRANNRASRDLIQSGDTPDWDEIQICVNMLENADAMGFEALGGRFVGLVHPNVKFDLCATTFWKNRAEQNPNPAAQEAFGSYYLGDAYNVTWVSSTAAVRFDGAGVGGAVNVYATQILGQGAYGVQNLQALQMIAKQLGSGGTSDPLNQRSTLGWKTAFGSAILWDQYKVQYESASSRG